MTIEERLARLEKRVRRYRDVTAVLALALVTVVMGAAVQDKKPKVPEVVRAKKFEVVDSKGDKTVAVLGANVRGGGLSIRSTAGQELVALQIDHLGGWIQVTQNDGRPGVRLDIGPITATTTAGVVDTFDSKGKTAVVLSSGDESGVAVSMGAGVRGGVIGLFRDGAQHLLDPLALDKMKAALRGDGK